MVRRRAIEGVPADYFSGAFPDGTPVDAVPVPALYAAAVASSVRAELSGRSLSAVCRDAGLARSTVQDLVAGRTWPDLVTLAKLEGVLDVRLWPDRDAVRRP